MFGVGDGRADWRGGGTDETKSSFPIQIGPQGFRVLTNGCLVTAASQRTGMTLRKSEHAAEGAVFSAHRSAVSVVNKVRIEWGKG